MHLTSLFEEIFFLCIHGYRFDSEIIQMVSIVIYDHVSTWVMLGFEQG